jgi:glycosyltransferase involved in cell wall biosynthesis
MNKCLVIIPAYKEQLNIGTVVAELRRYGYPILVVDDSSPDETSAKAAEAGALVVRHPYNMGYAVALQTGYLYAIHNGYDKVVQLDADGQHSPTDVPQLLQHLRDNALDIVIGSRFLGVGSYAMQGMRFIGKSLLCALIRWKTGKIITDPTSGYQALSHKTLTLYTSEVFADEYPDADMLILAIRYGCSIEEIGVTMRHNDTGQSMHSGIIRPIYYMFRMLIGIFIASIRSLEDIK